MLEAGANPNLADHGGVAPLFVAANGMTVSLLHEFGAQLQAFDNNGTPLLEYVEQSGRQDAADRIRELSHESLLCVMLHEMTHIWQFSLGRRGGHGQDFYQEMARIGIREREQLCENGSPADAVLREAKENHPHLCHTLRSILETDIPQPKYGDEEFFFELLAGE